MCIRDRYLPGLYRFTGTHIQVLQVRIKGLGAVRVQQLQADAIAVAASGSREMCIRDRVTPEAAPEVQRLLCSRLELSGKRVFVQKSPLDPVSYTHLDVYKRQVCGWK